VDLDLVAERTDGFSGADLQALIYNATLESIHSSLEPKSISLSQDLPQDITYTVLGAPLEKTRSKADESAFQKQVTGGSVCLFTFLLKRRTKLLQITKTATTTTFAAAKRAPTSRKEVRKSTPLREHYNDAV
jgi:SpoVK/Ycf46/Vps4 family AAA+-type ATPase